MTNFSGTPASARAVTAQALVAAAAVPNCGKHSRPLTRLGAKSYCPECIAEGASKTREAMTVAFDRLRQNELESRVDESGIPDLFLEESFDTFDPPTDRAAQVAVALKNYAKHFADQRGLRTGFVFTGAPGTAKTHLACAMALEILVQGYTVRYISLTRLTMEVRRTFKNGSDTIADIIGGLVNCDFLVLDEIDLHGASDNDYQVLYEIINGRYELGNRPTLALSNRPVSELIVDLNERLISRLLSGTQPIVFNWQGRRDCRTQAHAAKYVGGGR